MKKYQNNNYQCLPHVRSFSRKNDFNNDSFFCVRDDHQVTGNSGGFGHIGATAHGCHELSGVPKTCVDVASITLFNVLYYI